MFLLFLDCFRSFHFLLKTDWLMDFFGLHILQSLFFSSLPSLSHFLKPANRNLGFKQCLPWSLLAMALEWYWILVKQAMIVFSSGQWMQRYAIIDRHWADSKIDYGLTCDRHFLYVSLNQPKILVMHVTAKPFRILWGLQDMFNVYIIGFSWFPHE